MKTFIVIAAFNEEKSISKVVSKLHKKGYHNIVVVDDGSKDNAFKVIAKLKCHALKHIINRGQGAALKTGIDYAIGEGADVIVTFDADGQHKADEIQRLVDPIRKKEVEVTLGSRFLGKAQNIGLAKKIVLKIGVLVIFILYGLKLTDSQNGFRAISRKAAQKIQIKSDRMEHAGEIIGEVRSNKLKFKEVPVTIIYSDYSTTKGQKASAAFKLGVRMIMRKILS